ncbi:penicillin-binding protein 2 [Azoarcus taiwanensis]|uniref:Peptidoglycan D,D-transpeptidase MrdA n=1 Tax=Azoarcus taiwanensis TaxID=666964 RepID=A0A972F8E1_9RHOO|nr:penicillin-binding protein 2 [Azoarcus taiwanensis]NMG01769.1 penicillin-binding protein 2 [Azoarcus taiwanensis]
MTEFRSPEAELAAFRRRLLVAALFVTVCFGLLAARFYYLQVVRFDYFHARAEGNRIAVLPVVPNRGVIVDRNGTLLARNYSVLTLEINPARVRNLDATIDALGEIVTIEERDRRRFRRLLLETKYFESVPIRTHLTDEEVARIAVRLYRFPGVEVQARLFRDYPEGASTAHVVGYIGRINERDQQRIEERGETANYRGSEYIGKSGLELSYQRELHGTTGIEQVEINAGGRAVRLMSRTPAIPGNDLQLTLDIGLQQAAEAALGNRRGAVVAIEPATGGVLALASTPSFDPNLFIDGISVAEWRALSDSPEHPLLNRALYSAYPPGSTYKPFIALLGLESGKRQIEQRFNNQGLFTFVGQRYVDRKSRCQHNVDLHGTIVHSCNTYYYQLAHDLGIQAIADFMGQFGFGQRTGIDVPGEATGVLPSPAWKRSRFSSREQQQWYGGETISVGIGQGYNAFTPIQLANGLATLLNGGNLFRPHVVSHIVDSVTGERRLVEPEPIARIPLNPRHVDAIRQAMADVTVTGTAVQAFRDAPYTSGGKTGTAQVFSLRGQRYDADKIPEHLRDHAWYIGFAPAENPTIALAVLVENGGFGGQSAAPVARQVFDYYLLGAPVEAPAQEGDPLLAEELER